MYKFITIVSLCLLIIQVCCQKSSSKIESSTVGNSLPVIPTADGSTVSSEVSENHETIQGNSHDDDAGGGGEHPTKGHKKEAYPWIKIEFLRVSTPFIIGAWIFLSGIAKIGFHVSPKLSSICPESCMLILLGMVIGVALFYSDATKVAPLTPDIFFLFMLPPIVMEAGYFMPNRRFFDNLGAILLFAVLGTIWNAMAIGFSLWSTGLTGLFGVELTLLECLLFSSLISAVDPVAVLAVFQEIHVNEVLYILVFGESLLNDAVTVVLYHMFEKYTEMEAMEHVIAYTDILAGLGSFFIVSLGGTLIGVIWGLLTSFVTRFTYHVRVIEPLFVLMMAYLSYLTAEIFHMSGILAIIFCGITMKNYVEGNISQKSHTTVKYSMKMLANASETIIFLFLGISTINDSHDWNTWFVFFTIIYCSIFRALGVVVLTSFCNRSRVSQITNVDEFVMAYGGLRGAVAFALVVSIADNVTQHKDMMTTTCIAVVYFTVFIQGTTIGPLVQFLGVKRSQKKKLSMNERIHVRFMDHVMAGIEEVTGNTGNHHVRDKFKYYNDKYFKHWFTQATTIKEPKILETYSKLNVKDALDIASTKGAMLQRMNTEMNLSSIFRSYTLANLSTCPSSASLADLSSPNIDLHHLEYNPGSRDLDDAKLHHVLSEAMFKPVHEQQKYKKYDVCEWNRNHPPFHHKTRMQIRHLISAGGHRIRRPKRDKSTNNLKNSANNLLKIPHNNLPNPSNDHQTKETNGNAVKTKKSEELAEKTSKMDKITEDEDEGIIFSAAPARDRSSKAWSVGSDNEGGGSDSTVPADFCDHANDFRLDYITLTESVLPWKRDETDVEHDKQVFKQQEFPAWIDNRDYVAYQSPTSTYLGGLLKEPDKPSVMSIFENAATNDTSTLLISNDNEGDKGHDNPAFSDEVAIEMEDIDNRNDSQHSTIDDEFDDSRRDSSNDDVLTYL